MVDFKQLANLPSVDYLLKHPDLKERVKESPNVWKETIRHLLENIRSSFVSNELVNLPTEEEIIHMILNEKKDTDDFSLKRVINATGTIVHTNLGRSLLSSRVKEQLETSAFSYSNLEYNLEKGERGSRYQHLEKIIQKLTGAEDVVVVNNNAAAVMLALSTLIPNKEVVISRGELVEIGGSFRIPEVIELSGGMIKEVGTTNKTHLKDYEKVITEETGAIMKVHTSNYRVIGFTESPEITELAELAHSNNIPLINDLGSGLLIDMQQFGLPYEPTIKESLDQGCDVVMFSGDKLLGGPQVGVIVGKKEFIEPMKKNQLLRALRVDKLTLSALEATLSLYLEPEVAVQEIPTLQMISKSYEECLEEAKSFEEKLSSTKWPIQIKREAGKSQVGGGSYPEYQLPTELVGISSDDLSTTQLEEKLRKNDLPIITRVKNNCVWFDVRTIREGEMEEIMQQLTHIFQ